MPQFLTIIDPRTGERRDDIPLPDGANFTDAELFKVIQDAGIQTHSVTSSPTEPGAAPAQPASGPTTPREAFNTTLHAVSRAVGERTIEPAKTLFTLNPNVGTLPRLAAVAQLGALATPAAWPYLAAGAGVQAGSEAAGMSPEGASLVGGATEIGASLWNIGSTIRAARKAGTALLQSAREQVKLQARMGTKETIGAESQVAIRGRFHQLEASLKPQFNQMETRLAREAPEVLPGSPAYADLDSLLSYIDDAEASAGGRADAILTKIRDAVNPAAGGTQQPVKTQDLIKLRKILQERAGTTHQLDPDASIVGRKAASMRDLVMDVIEGNANPQTRADYRALRTAWQTQVVDPEMFLKAVTGRNVTPLQAFKALFATDDPHRLRVAVDALQHDASLMGKMKLGFAESMQDVLANPGKAGPALSRLEAFEPLLLQSNMFSSRELADLKFLLESKRIPSLISELTSNARSQQVLLRGAVGVTAATQISSNPFLLITSAIAFGGLPQLRRAAMLPTGSQAQRVALTLATRRAALGIQQMFSGQKP